MNFEQYYKGFGFTKYPFAVFTSEGEREELVTLFLKPENYSVIVEGLRNTSAIVVGERGTGKTALSLSIENDLGSDKKLLVRIEEYSALKTDYVEEDLYNFLIERIATAFFLHITENPKILWKYTKEERLDLSMYLHVYLSASSKAQLKEKINKIQNNLLKRMSVGLYNFGRVFINYGLKAATKVISDAITKHFSSLPEFDVGDAEYFKKIEGHVDQGFIQERRQYFYLERLCKLIRKHSFEKISVVLDKIDEDARFENDAEAIGDFIKGIAANNKVLTNEQFHMLLFLWSTPFNHIRSKVRTQKLTLQHLEWGQQQLEQVVCRRIQAFSDGKLTELTQILGGCSQQSIDLVFKMCNRNPRDLWHILDKCFKEQFTIDPMQAIGDKAVELGVNKYVVEFNYYEYYPKKSRARTNSMDVYSFIKHLLKLDNTSFTKDRLNEMAGTGSSTNNYVVSMENMGLIKKTSSKAANNAVIYEICDPKVSYAMQNNIQIDNN